MKLDIPLPSELTVLQNIGDHPYALCHRDNAEQVADQNIENLLLILNPAHTLSITREGDADPPSPYLSGWVMLLDNKAEITRAIRKLTHIFENQ